MLKLTCPNIARIGPKITKKNEKLFMRMPKKEQQKQSTIREAAH